MNFKTLSDLSSDLVENMYKIPRDVDVVVGIPRSGLLVATFIALYINKPVTDLDSFLEKKIYGAGTTKLKDGWIHSFDKIKKVLVVEDSVNSGQSLFGAKEKIEKADFDVEYTYLAAYVTKARKKDVDIYLDIVEQPRLFEWNYLCHRSYIPYACFDIDGVLCVDPTDDENDDGEKYINFIRNAKPKLVVTSKIGWIVTSRLEKYRKETEKWLKKNNIAYDKLIMMNLESAEERRRLGNHAEFKAQVYKEQKRAMLFVESNDYQARRIQELTNKAVFCPTSMQFYNEGRSVTAKRTAKSNLYIFGSKVLPAPVKNKLKSLRKLYENRKN